VAAIAADCGTVSAARESSAMSAFEGVFIGKAQQFLGHFLNDAPRNLSELFRLKE
jgi:hypothetical protein